MNETNVSPVSPEELSTFVAALSAAHYASLKAAYPTCELNWETISFTVGKKYARLITTHAGETRSAFGFIDLTNGNILKCAGWATPAKGARGNIRRGDVSNLWNGAFVGHSRLHVAYAR